MAATAHAKLSISVDMLASLAEDLGSQQFNTVFSKVIDLVNGAGNSQVNAIFADTRTLALSTAEDLDIKGTSLQDVLGANVSLAHVRWMLVYAAPTNGSTISVKPAASNGFLGPFGAAAHKQSIPAGGWWFVTAPVAGWPVTAATADLFNVANDDSAAAGSYTIVIGGN